MKNIDYVNSIVAEKRNTNKNIVKKINSIYWKTVKHSMSNLEDTTVFIKGFVSFTVSRYLMNEKIKDVISYIRNLSKSTKFTENKKRLITENYYIYLRKLLYQRNEIAKREYERTKRNNLQD